MRFPPCIGTMVNALYNIVDRIFIGQEWVLLAISGLTLTFPILLFMQAFGMLIGAGAATRVSIHLGRKANDLADNVLGNAFTLTFIIGALTIIPSMIFLDDLLMWFGGSEQTIPYAKDYLYIAIPGNLLATLSFSFNAVMQCFWISEKGDVHDDDRCRIERDPRPDLYLLAGYGDTGAAIATVISMAAGAAFVMSHFISKDSIVRFHTKYFRLKGPIIWNIFTIGMSPFSMQLAGSVVVVIMNHALKENGGDLAIGASGIISSIAMLLVMLIIGIAQGMQPIVGFNHGAGHHDRVLATLRLSIIVSTLITGVGCIVSLLFPRLIVSVFSTDAELVSITDNGLRLTMLVFFVVGSQITISQFFQSIGVAWKAMFLSLSRQVLFLIPAILLFPPIWGLDGVWLAQPFSDFIAAVTAWGFLWYHVKNVKNKG